MLQFTYITVVRFNDGEQQSLEKTVLSSDMFVDGDLMYMTPRKTDRLKVYELINEWNRAAHEQSTVDRPLWMYYVTEITNVTED